MADEVKTPEVKPEVTKVEATPAEAKSAEVAKPAEVAKEPTSLLSETPKEAPKAETAKEPAKGEAAKAAEVLKEEPKPVEDAKKAAAEAKPAEAKPAEAAIEYKFKLPEGVTLDDKELGKFTQILGKNHATPEFAQELMDLYTTEARAMVERFVSEQRSEWSKLNETWINEVRADPEIGGNRIDTVLQATRNLVEQFGGNASEKKALRDMLASTGAGNHPAMARFLYRITKALGEGSPVPAPTPAASPDKTNLTRAERRYGKGNAASP